MNWSWSRHEAGTLMIQVRFSESLSSTRVREIFVVVVVVVIWIKQYSSGLSINFVTGKTQTINLC